MLQTTRFQQVEVIVPSAGVGVQGRIKIEDQPQLRTQSDQTVVIQALETYDIISQPLSPTGRPLPSVAQLSNAYLVLNIFGYENLQYIPMNSLNNIQSTDTSVQRFFTNRLFRVNEQFRVDWTKSYILSTAAIASPANVSFLIGVHYYIIPDDTANTVPLPQPYRIMG